ncbi:hypothetical protein Cgig2_013092 [Carnegiea gigantea]|uniref:Protein transport protein sec16 n=1 Tax=Carnegiea gigantea TaxID=171969 RepID=A0A9Q1QP78_9CARY|nr:hypothetical protein Cgig2_013092 [Carnegiea gigantea]
MAQPEQFGNSEDISSPENAQFGRASIFDSGSRFNGLLGFNGVTESQAYAPPEQFWQHNSQRNMEFDKQFSTSYFNGPKVVNFSQKPPQSSIQSYASSEGTSSAGRPPHALVAFGFGGKLIVIKDPNTLHMQARLGSNSAAVIINVLDIIEIAMPKRDFSDAGFSACDYLCSLCQQSFRGPLVSGNVGAKELHKWIDRIANCATQVVDHRKGEALKMLFSLLKIACQFYGKLRSAFSTDLVLKSQLWQNFLHQQKETVCSLVLSIVACRVCLLKDNYRHATADQVRMLLVLGRRMEALKCAQKGQLWGPAIVIAALLGEQFYGETVKQMALHQLVAGQPAEVFSNPIANNQPSLVNFSQPVQVCPSCMLDEWEENLAIITANRTKGDELVITHLGDCLWKERGESLKAGRSPEVDAWRHMLSAFEERIKIHQQGGYTTHLAPTKLVGKLLNFFDNTAHRVVGGLPPPIDLLDESPKKSDPSGDSGPHDNSSTAGSSSRFGRFGLQIFQKTLGLGLRSRPDQHAKLGEKNKFYYDDKLKRWVEEGAGPPAEEPALASPPTTAAFMNGVSCLDKKDESNNAIHANGQAEFKSANSFEKKAGTPPLPSGANQFSACGRMGVHARYVDTFNKGGGTQPKLFQSRSVPTSKPAIGNAKFFMPTPVTHQEADTSQNTQEAVQMDEDTTTSNRNHSVSSPQMLSPPPMTPPAIPQHPSMEELASQGTVGMINGNGSMPLASRRSSSWSGGLGDMSTCQSRFPG